MSDITATTYIDRIQASYGYAFAELAKRYSPANGQGHFLGQLVPYATKHPLRATALAGASALAIGASVSIWGPVATIAQGIGIAAFVLARESATFKDHRHILAVASASCLLSATQQGMMAAVSGDPGSYIPGGVMLAHAAATLTGFAIIPEDKKILRRAVTWGGGLAGAFGAAAAAKTFGNDNGLIPAVTTLGNAVLFSMNDTNTPKARVGYLGMNVGHTFYWATQPVQSLALLGTELMYIATHGITARHNDVPIQDKETGEAFSPAKQRKLYFWDVLVRGEKAEDLGATRASSDEPRLDDAIYDKIGNLVLGKS